MKTVEEFLQETNDPSITVTRSTCSSIEYSKFIVDENQSHNNLLTNVAPLPVCREVLNEEGEVTHYTIISGQDEFYNARDNKTFFKFALVDRDDPRSDEELRLRWNK